MQTEQEIWAFYPTDARFMISTLGRVKGVRKILTGYRDKDGYHCFQSWTGKKCKGHKVHRAVVSTFMGPIPDGMQVNHKNGIKDDNRLENLEIVTPSQNTKHGWDALGRSRKLSEKAIASRARGERHHNSKLTAEQVMEIRKLYAAGTTQVKLAELFGTPQTNISNIVRGTSWSHLPRIP